MRKITISKEWGIPAAVGVSAFAAGVGAGFIIGLRRGNTITTFTEEVTTELVVEIDEDVRSQLSKDFAAAVEAGAIRHPSNIYTQQDLKRDTERQLEDSRLRAEAPRIEMKVVNPERFDDIADSVVLTYPAPGLTPDPEPEMSTHDDIDDWDQEAEEDRRDSDTPYTIHREEFYANETDFEQEDLEYFAGDDFLCDAQRKPIYNYSAVVGDLEFGRGSGDPDLVFVRNEKLHAEYQITRQHHSYQTEVLGIEAEEEAEEEDLRHSANVLKFRHRD